MIGVMNDKSKTVGRNGSSASPLEPAPMDGSSVGKIRDIIFGEQMLQYEERFSDLESQLIDRVNQLKSQVDGSIDELKSLVEKEKAEANERNIARQQLAEMLEGMAKQIREGL